jgi:CubicO group peptidase (beta-lactamase class C family)
MLVLPLRRSLLAFLSSAALAGQSPPWLPAVDAVVAKRLAEPHAVGFSVGVARDGEVLLAKGYGKADLEFDVPADGETMFRIGSITKQFTAALVMLAIEAGKLSLDDGVERFVPDFPLQGRKVTIRHLLDHTSGIKSYTDVGEAWRKQWPLELTHAELLALVADKPFDFEPGADWRYNNTGYYLLGMVLEKVHGAPYADVVRDEVCVPLGLARTRYDSNRDLIKNRAQGYGFAGGAFVNDQPLGLSQPGAAGGLLSTGGDLVRWSNALASGKVVTAASHARMTTATVIDGRDRQYGFGLMLGEFAGQRAWMHGGGIHGFNSFLVCVPEHRLHVAVVSNGERASSQKLAAAIVREVLGLPEVLAKDLPLPTALRDELVGDYAFADLGTSLRVTAVGDKLAAKGQAEGQRAFGLMFQGGREFRADFDHSVRLEWSSDGKSLTLHQNGRVAAGVRQ